MPGKQSREKGKRGEREAAKFLADILGIPLSRGVQHSGSPDSPDISGLKDFGVHPEVKRDERTASASLYKAIKQAEEDSGSSIPFVITRKNREEWLIVIRGSDLNEFASIISSIKKKSP